MLLQLKLICEQKRAKKDGTSAIYLQYYATRREKTLLKTGISIPPIYWNESKLCIKAALPIKYGDWKELNDELKKVYRLTEDLITLAEKKNISNVQQFLKKLFDPNLDFYELVKNEHKLNEFKSPESVKQNVDIYFQLDDYIKCKDGKVAKSTLSIFANLGRQLKTYETFTNSKITFDTIDYDFYDRFSRFLMFDYVQERLASKPIGLKQNSIRKAVVQLRRLVNDRQKRKLIPKTDPVEFPFPEEESDAIYLSTAEIQAIADVDLTAFPYLIPYRNRFVVACLTGLRFSDFSRMKKEDVRNGYLYKKQEKSEKWVIIPLRPLAKKFLDKIFNERESRTSNPDFNEKIKVIGKLAGIFEQITFSYKKGNKKIEHTRAKCDWIGTHTGRRSFCTNEFLAGTPTKLIMGISGHKKEKDFYRYIRIGQEEAAAVISKIWENRAELEGC